MAEIHNFKVGDQVWIINRTASGKFFVEGEAVIVKLLNAEDHYRVRFANRTFAERFADPQATSRFEAEALVARLNQ